MNLHIDCIVGVKIYRIFITACCGYWLFPYLKRRNISRKAALSLKFTSKVMVGYSPEDFGSIEIKPQALSHC